MVHTKRQNRGYVWEHELINRINDVPDWIAKRLGGSSVNLPDILAINNKDKRLLAIECKSGGKVKGRMTKSKGEVARFTEILYVPPDEIVRCISMAEAFELYKSQAVFAFKFSRGAGFKTKMYYYVLPEILMSQTKYAFDNMTCYLDGRCKIEYTDVQTKTPVQLDLKYILSISYLLTPESETQTETEIETEITEKLII